MNSPMRRFFTSKRYIPLASEVVTFITAIGALALLVYKWLKEMRG